MTGQLFDGGTAVIDGEYRYRLWRSTGAPGTTSVLFIMLNPSTADASTDDATIRRITKFARDWGHGGLFVANLYALRSTDPRALYSHPDPVGPGNDAWIRAMAATVDLKVAAWGAHQPKPGRAAEVMRLLGPGVTCLGITKDGHPRHPLRLRADLTPIPFVLPDPRPLR